MTPEPAKERRAVRLHHDAVADAPRPWRVRTGDGAVRGPLGVEQLKALVEVHILTPDAMIAPANEERWVVLETHEVWAVVKPRKKGLVVRAEGGGSGGGDGGGAGGVGSERADGEAAGASVGAMVSAGAATPRMRERMEAVREEERRRVLRGLVWWRCARGVRVLGGALVFLCFVTAGDFVRSLFPESAGIFTLCALLAVLAVALMYYTIKALED